MNREKPKKNLLKSKYSEYLNTRVEPLAGEMAEKQGVGTQGAIVPQEDLRKATLPRGQVEQANAIRPGVDRRVWMQGFRERLKPHKSAIHEQFERALKELVGWMGSDEESVAFADDLSREAIECGVRFAVSDGEKLIPVSLSYKNRVFTLTTDGGGYGGSSKTFMELSVIPRVAQAGKKRAKKQEKTAPAKNPGR